MAYFIPSFIQKRILRYVLSHLELLETEDFDLDNLNIEWGKRSSVELRDLGIRIQKLSTLLQLPPNFLLVKAKVSLLRITVPADLYKNGILIEADGLELRLDARENEKGKSDQQRVSPKDGERLGPDKGESDQTRSNQYHVHDPGGHSQPSTREHNAAGRRSSDHLPTAIDLAESFLEAEPQPEKAKLHSALAQSQYADQSQIIGEYSENAAGLGVGAGISLPGFVADFLKGIANRVQLIIRNTDVDLAVDLMIPSGKTAAENSQKAEQVTLKLSVGEVALDGITDTPSAPAGDSKESESQYRQGPERLLPKESLRRITLRRLKGMLVAESSLFTYLIRCNVPPSPNTTQSSAIRRANTENSSPSLPLGTSAFGAEIYTSTPVIREATSYLHSPTSLPTLHLNQYQNEDVQNQSVVTSTRPDSSDLGSSQPQQNDMKDSIYSDSRSSHDKQSPLSDIPGSFSPPHTSRSSHSFPEELFVDNPSFVQNETSGQYVDSPLNSSNQALESGQNSPQLLTLAQSKLFSHEEAESMYMSAMTYPASGEQSAFRSLKKMPGDWGDSGSEDEQRTVDKEQAKMDATGELASTENPGSGLRIRSLYSDTPELTAPQRADQESTREESIQSIFAKQADTTVTAASTSSQQASSNSSQASSSKFDRGLLVVKEIFDVDVVVIELCEAIIANEDSVQLSKRHQPPSEQHEPGSGSASTRYGPRRSVKVGAVTILGDLGLTKLAIITIQRFVELLKPASLGLANKPESKRSSSRIMIRVKRFSWRFLDLVRGLSTSCPSTSSPDLQPAGKPDDAEVLLKAVILNLKINLERDGLSSSSVVSVGKFSFGYATENVISFDSGLKLRESTRDILAPIDQDMILKITESPHHRHWELTTLPLHIRLDLRRLDETFSWFGGFSSIIGLGNSMMSTITVVDISPNPSRPARSARGVHFEHEPLQSRPLVSEVDCKQKITIRFGSVVLDFEGACCSFRLESTAVKVVSREEGIGLAVDRLNLTGPDHGSDASTSSINAKLIALRVEYLTTPKDVDLARLLGLLSPSKDGYKEEDDDILLGTLFRQRRQGGVVRVNAERVEFGVLDIEDLHCLPALGEEMKKLSTVAKYLPADDRPGIMTILLVRELHAQAKFLENVGTLQLTAKNAEVAHISIPSLVALGIGKLSVTRNSSEELLGEAEGAFVDKASPPTIMARYVGNELEPTVKIRLYSLRAEYHVSTITLMLGLHEEVTQGKLASLASSIATVTGQQRARRSPPQLSARASGKSDTCTVGSKTLKIDFALRDVILGLNPRNSPARGLLVLTDAHLVSTLPKDELVSARLEINKASLLAIDDAKNVIVPNSPSKRVCSSGQDSQMQHLLDRGYVSLSYVSAIKATLEVVRSALENGKTVELELRDNLLVIESCADSTQTLQAILNGLQPPSPSNKEPRFRTEVVPVEDMLASFSGKPFVAPGQDNSQDANVSLELDDADMMEDDVPQNLEFVSSFYNPDPISLNDSIAQSMLEGDLEASPKPTATRNIGDKPLLESFQDRFEVAPNESTLHFRDDHFGNNSSVGGTAHRWNVKKNTYELTNEPQIRASPLRVRVRDVHVIWNLFDGYDWQKTRDAISQAVAAVEEKATEQRSKRHQRQSLDAEEEEESVIGDFLFNSIYIGIPTNRDPKELSRQVNRNIDDLVSETESYATSSGSGSPSRQSREHRSKGRRLRLRRSKYHKMTFELKGVSADMMVFPPDSGETQSSVDIRVNDFEIFDHVPTSTWKKFATYMHDAGERESGTAMIHLEILNVKPIPTLTASEMILKVNILPLRLHVDQDALDFMMRFFEFKDESTLVTNLKTESPFLQRVEVQSVPVKLDFKPKRVDYAGLRSGHTTEFMNFFILDQADMVLRHVIIYGVSGFDRLGKTLNDIWSPDVKRNQLSRVLAGLAPVRSLVNVGGGVKDLVVVPIREYRKDGRVVRSFQKGALAFAKTTTSELAKLGAKLALGTQTVLQGAEGFLAPDNQGPDLSYGWEEAEFEDEDRKKISLYADQPVGVVQGLRGGYASLERDLLMAKDAIVAMPGEVMDSGSAGGAARAVLRTAPTVILRPAMGVSKAVGQTLMGATNSLDPANRRRADDVSVLDSAQINADRCRQKYKRH
ncbi:MAG: hypothetical protein Q9191_000047 [Dirinaria sp. TL-2023a]